MKEMRSARMAVPACLACIALAMIAGASPAAAKTKTKVFSRCVSVAVPIPDGPVGNTDPNPDASLAIPVTVPRFKRRRQNGQVTAINSVAVRISHTDDGDLALFLVSPGGRAIALATYRDDSGPPAAPSGDGYGTGAAD